MLESLIIFLLIGLAAGWLAGQILNRPGDWVRNLVVGVIGSIVGGFVFRLIGLASYGTLAKLVTATVGAVLLLVAINYLQKQGRSRD